MEPNTAVCVFCGSRFGDRSQYRALAEDVGRRLVGAGARLVYGGGGVGLMGAVSNAVLDAGGHVTGIIPEFLRHVEGRNDGMTRSIISTSMFDRKQAMFDLSDGFLALPGGLGTLDEIIEVLTWRQLNQLAKPMVLLSEDDFWRPFCAAIDHAIAHEFADPSAHNLYSIAGSVDEALVQLGLMGNESAASAGV